MCVCVRVRSIQRQLEASMMKKRTLDGLDLMSADWISNSVELGMPDVSRFLAPAATSLSLLFRCVYRLYALQHLQCRGLVVWVRVVRFQALSAATQCRALPVLTVLPVTNGDPNSLQIKRRHATVEKCPHKTARTTPECNSGCLFYSLSQGSCCI